MGTKCGSTGEGAGKASARGAGYGQTAAYVDPSFGLRSTTRKCVGGSKRPGRVRRYPRHAGQFGVCRDHANAGLKPRRFVKPMERLPSASSYIRPSRRSMTPTSRWETSTLKRLRLILGRRERIGSNSFCRAKNSAPTTSRFATKSSTRTRVFQPKSNATNCAITWRENERSKSKRLAEFELRRPSRSDGWHRRPLWVREPPVADKLGCRRYGSARSSVSGQRRTVTAAPE